jgi:hypothetical protein
MSLASSQAIRRDATTDWPELMHELGPRFAERAGDYDAADIFVKDNFAEL